ncbi:MAG: Ger(x)C family spore germination protein [Acutalibacteraceae bacterium]|nr:Ger(x)C family spore germination protein [Clostridiales bacterium]
MKAKITMIVLILISMCFLFTGCLTSSLGVDETIVMQAIGIDLDFEKAEYKVTIECFDLSKASGGGKDGVEEKPQYITTYGKSIEQAIMNTTKITGVNPIYSQNRVIVFGDSILKNGLEAGFDVFIRDYRTRSSTPVVAAKGFTASDVVKAKSEGLSAFPASTLQAIVKSGKINSLTKEVTVMELVKMCEEKTTAAYIPAITLVKEGDDYKAKSDGIAILKDRKLCGYLDSNETRAMLSVINEIESGTVTLEKSAVGISTLEISESKTRVKMEITPDGNLKYIINISSSLDLMETEFRKDCELTEKEIKMLKKDVEKYIKHQVDGTLNKCLVEYRCDPFRFGQRLWQENPKEYRKVSGDWEDVLPNIQTDVNVDVKIRRIGRHGVK